MKRVPPLPLTKEHGSWAVMAVPLLVGTAAAERVVWEHLVLVITALAAFLSYVPAQTVMGGIRGGRIMPGLAASAAWWLRVLASIVVAGLLWLLAAGEWHLLVWGSVALVSFAVHEQIMRWRGKSIWGDFVGSLGLSVGAPAAFLLDGTTQWERAVTLWTFMALFFGCSVVYVHMKIRVVASKVSVPSWWERLRFGWVTLAYHAAVILLVAAIVSAGHTGPLALVAYIPMAFHAALGTIRLAGRVRFKRLGFLLLAHSILFAFLMVVAWRSEP